jgi:hypothetical protein
LKLFAKFDKKKITKTKDINQINYLNVQIDAIGIGLANAAAAFLPVFLTRLGGTNIQVGLLTSMPAITGFLFAIIIGQFLQSRRNIVPWFSAARLMVVSAYALTGLVTFIVPRDMMVISVLAIWAIATIPQTVVTIAFSVVMNAVAGPTGRFELMSKRWSILGLTTAITVAIVGQILDRLYFPINYQIIFISLSVGGLISYYYSSHIRIPDTEIVKPQKKNSLFAEIAKNINLVRQESAFITITIKRFVFITGTTLATPLLPLYYVREIHANDSWIGIINTTQTAILLVGYLYWARQSRSRGARPVLLWSTIGLSLYPVLVAMTHNLYLIVIFAGISGIFQAGQDLVFFDELMKTVPVQYSALFVSVAQSVQFLSTMIAPILGTFLADQIGIGGALIVSAGIRFAGFLLFAFWKTQPIPQQIET